MNIAALVNLQRPVRSSANVLRLLLGSANNPVAGSRILAQRRLVP